MADRDDSQDTGILLALLEGRELKASEIRRKIDRATYAAIGLYVAAVAWAVQRQTWPARGCPSPAAILSAAALLPVLVVYIAYWTRMRTSWKLEHRAILEISTRLGCFEEGRFGGGQIYDNALRNDEPEIGRAELIAVALACTVALIAVLRSPVGSS